MKDTISRWAAAKAIYRALKTPVPDYRKDPFHDTMGLAFAMADEIPSAEPEDYTELKQEFIRMAEYIDIFLKCPDEQKEVLIGFVTRLAKHMPWTKED